MIWGIGARERNEPPPEGLPADKGHDTGPAGVVAMGEKKKLSRVPGSEKKSD